MSPDENNGNECKTFERSRESGIWYRLAGWLAGWESKRKSNKWSAGPGILNELSASRLVALVAWWWLSGFVLVALVAR